MRNGIDGIEQDQWCQNCHERQASVNWVGEGGALAAVHGMVARWCKVCVLEKQIEHAEKMEAMLPSLRSQLNAALRS